MKTVETLILILLSVFSIAQTPIEDFDKIMQEYNDAFTATDDTKEQELINDKYNKLIDRAQEILDKAIEQEIQIGLDSIRLQEENFAIPEEVDYTTVVSPIEGVHLCYFEDSLEAIVANKTIGGNHKPVLKILDLSSRGDEREKVKRIITELKKRGFR